MTVCIAALCQKSIIFGAADRMVTTTDIQFEPLVRKIHPITNSMIIMTAGDSVVHTEILRGVVSAVYKQIEEKPEEWWSIKAVADLYAKGYSAVRSRHAEASLLSPFGLTVETFITRQQQMAPSFIEQISGELLNYHMPHTSAIVAGIDTTGPHIFVVRQEHVACFDAIGFASIGAGSRHAESQFMFAGHSPNASASDTLLLTYTSKKRAEVAPGVGKDTDVVVLGPQLGSSTPVNEEVMQDMDDIYQKAHQSAREVQEEARENARQYFEELAKRGEEGQQKLEEPGNTR